MEALAVELDACLAELGQPDSDRTVIMTPSKPAKARRPPKPPARRSLAARLFVLGAVLAALVAGAAAYFVLRDSGGGGNGGAAKVHLVASNAYDPEGDGQEHDELVSNATDGNRATSWETEDYHGSVTFGNLKDGVGIVVDAGRPVKLDSLTVDSDTPGFTAEVKAGSSATGPFDTVSSAETVNAQTTFSLTVPTPRAVLPALDHAARARRPENPCERSDCRMSAK